MEFTLSAEQAAVRRLAAEFVDREVVPHAAAWDRRESVDQAIVGALGDLGFRDGTDWLLTGTKTFITNGTTADVALVFARTGGPGHRGITAFLVPTGSPGLIRREIHGKLGLRGQATGNCASTTYGCRTRHASARRVSASAWRSAPWPKAGCRSPPAASASPRAA